MNHSISSKNFDLVYNNSIIVKTPNILYRVLPSGSRGKIGFVVGRKLGSASKRNLFRRRVKSLYNQFFIKEQKKIDIIIVPKTINLQWLEIKDSFSLMVKKTHDI